MYTKVTDKKVTFNLENERGGEDKNVKETETKKRGRPRKMDKAESSKDYKTDSDSNTDSDIGIVKRTLSKTSSDLSDIPLKSSLKKRTQEFWNTASYKSSAETMGCTRSKLNKDICQKDETTKMQIDFIKQNGLDTYYAIMGI